jgi:hypothetical protein
MKLNVLKSGPRVLLGGLLLLLSCANTTVLAETTAMTIHVRADDAKFIGSGVGGLNVLIEDARTGELLASGDIVGGTGDTAALMTEGQTRGRSPVTGAAGFRAALDIDEPTRVRIRVTGPLAETDSIQSLTATTWVVPGRDMVDPGIILHMPGLLVDLVSVEAGETHIQVAADVSMMCGCPITEGGLWDAADFQVVTELYRDGEKISDSPLKFTGQTNRFSGQLTKPAPGQYRLVVYAYQAERDNVGVARETLVLD